MRRRLVVSYLLLVAVALTLFTVPVAISSSNLLRSTLETNVKREAQLFVPLVLRSDSAAATSIADRTRDFEGATGAKVRLVRVGDEVPDGQVAQALEGKEPKAVWGRNALLRAEGVSVVIPVRQDGRTVAAVQIVAPSDEVDDQIAGIWQFRISVGVIVLIASGALAFLLAGSLVRPLERVKTVARRLGDGEWSARAPEDGPAEIAELARTLNNSAATTEALLASQRSFVADASHQLRTPLTSMRLSLDNISDASEDPAIVRQVARVEGEVVRMHKMVEGLLALARAEVPAAPPTRIDLAQLVEDRREVWLPVLTEANVEWVTTVHGYGMVLATPGALEQILDNLVDNALKVVEAGTRIEVGVHDDGDSVLLSVRDHGPGLNEEQRSRAFDRFWRARTSGAGSGLGLSIVRNLSERDGGTVDLQSPDDGGLKVTIRLRRFS
ncbi:HAMP domain-containing sensor histidine kinase [Williamsia sp. CHRR-6]|uniref:sensor histidine kinase n=1 Tax=Williamsia sp. CHRR-6 TaxID=2835871 RepID=UPI001BD9D11C|nr:HAMP domain-containing sensor histidine kinase [Williamsia sp. CHRR-6]MBT0567613.1 HAMP domain-containing histidine kinase [Williamsia sp. CHRR-6]